MKPMFSTICLIVTDTVYGNYNFIPENRSDRGLIIAVLCDRVAGVLPVWQIRRLSSEDSESLPMGTEPVGFGIRDWAQTCREREGGGEGELTMFILFFTIFLHCIYTCISFSLN